MANIDPTSEQPIVHRSNTRRFTWQALMAMLAVIFAIGGVAGSLWLLRAADGYAELARYGYGLMVMTGVATLIPALAAVRGRKAWRVVALIAVVAAVGLVGSGIYGLSLANTFHNTTQDRTRGL